jgi:hypothetical protein
LAKKRRRKDGRGRGIPPQHNHSIRTYISIKGDGRRGGDGGYLHNIIIQKRRGENNEMVVKRILPNIAY